MANNNDILLQPSLQTHQAVQAKTIPKPSSTRTEGVAVEKAQVVKPQDDDGAAVSPLQQQQLQEKVAQLNDYVQHLNRNLQFSVDEQSGTTVVKVIDAETDELVRQIPVQEVLDASNAIEKYRGLLLETKV